ncbi:PREDICTED: membrane metallo-endopeptidase-like 1 [Habropoda laboriosa]|uniref:membrane metallo-endopeptidase-like 1 n=1 Tax=Habropoda laboriosa TaxID=597456 RepID=UPI00083D5ACB|nr:PREDICTED: membrane metallo-endopeptidase-like 1 [Habropoda laboriosa]
MLLAISQSFLLILVHATAITVEKEESTVCSTDECKEFARTILRNMNHSVDPCVDFYEYACGNWSGTGLLSSGESSWNMRKVSNSENKRKVEKMLKLEPGNDEIPSVRIAKEWYKACMDTGILSNLTLYRLVDGMNKRGMVPLVSILNEIGGWPITMALNKWNESGQKWQNIDDYYAHLRGSNLLHDVRVAAYGGNSSELTIVLDVPDMPAYTWMLHQRFDSDNQTVRDENELGGFEKYPRYISYIVSRIIGADGLDVPKEQLEKDIDDILDFQWKLSKITSLVDDYVSMTVKNFQEWYNDLKPSTEKSVLVWTKKIASVFKQLDIDIPEDTAIKITSPGYFERLVPLLDETPSRTIANYLHWNFVSSTIARTTNEMRELSEWIKGEEKQQARSELCLTEPRMDDVIAYEYSRRYFSNDTVELASDALNDMEREMEIEIEGSNWANREIKNLALRRIRLIKRNIAYPDWYNNKTIMENYFGELTMGSTYFENALELEKYYKLRELRRLKHEDEVESWIVGPLTINSFYFSESNSITVPLANLQEPFFTRAQPNTINYAVTGYTLAHEMYHPFDEERRLYNEYGKKISWPEEMTEEYYKSARCFVEQYNNYTLDGTPNGPRIENYGNQTFDENMPDTMGLIAAFRAYKRRESIKGKAELSLPGLETFTNNQIFFLSFTNVWCTSRDHGPSLAEAKLNTHSTARLRSIGSLSNNQDFANTFSCPLGSPMNPEKKCNIWKMEDSLVSTGQ